MRTKITILVGIALLAGFGFIIFSHRNDSSSASMTGALGGTSAGSESLNPMAEPGSVQSPTGTKTYTTAQVAQHSSSSSCWTAINGKVYDVTAWISQHPGGQQAILSLCGKDGSAAFNGQHGGQARPASELASFYIGVLGTVPSAGGAAVSGSASVTNGLQLAPAGSAGRGYDDDDD